LTTSGNATYTLRVLQRLQTAIRSRFYDGPYHGVRAAFLPMDVLLSLLAKRSYSLYRIWYEYGKRTDPFFGRDRPPTAESFDAGLLEQLRSRGYAMGASNISPSALATARDFVLNLADYARRECGRHANNGADDILWRENGITYEVIPSGGRTRLHFTAEGLARANAPEILMTFADAGWIRSLVAAYFGIDEIVVGLPYYMAEVMERAERLEPWHVDCIRPTVKAYLLLEDVGADQAPLRYLPGTHRVDGERHRLFYQICRGGLGAAYFDREDCRRFDREAIDFLAPKGTYLLFDNRGTHAGSLCRSGRRILLANGYRPITATRVNPRMFRDPRPRPYPWQRQADFWQT
jgi:hypothetical protein